MSTSPSSLAWRSVSAQVAWPAAARASTAARPAAPASGASPWSAVDPVRPERVERPVLQEDVDRLAERGGAGGQDRGGLQLVVRAGEEDQVQGLIHGGSPRGDGAWERPSVAMRRGGDGSVVMDRPARRRRRRSRTPRMMPQATMTSGSLSR